MSRVRRLVPSLGWTERDTDDAAEFSLRGRPLPRFGVGGAALVFATCLAATGSARAVLLPRSLSGADAGAGEVGEVGIFSSPLPALLTAGGGLSATLRTTSSILASVTFSSRFNEGRFMLAASSFFFAILLLLYFFMSLNIRFAGELHCIISLSVLPDVL